MALLAIESVRELVEGQDVFSAMYLVWQAGTSMWYTHKIWGVVTDPDLTELPMARFALWTRSCSALFLIVTTAVLYCMAIVAGIARAIS